MGAHTPLRPFQTRSEEEFCLFDRGTVCFLVLTVLRLPPGLEAVVGEGCDHVLDGVADVVVVIVVHPPGVAHETFLLLLRDREC